MQGIHSKAENKAKKISMSNPVAELDGDEMTRVLWQWIKDYLIVPFVDLKTDYYDLSLQNRDATDDRITHDAAAAIRRHRVGVKCATITPNAQRVTEYNLKRMYDSPNGTIRAALDGTVFRAPVISKHIKGYIPAWTSPITIARHAYGDVYKGAEMRVDGAARAELLVTYTDGRQEKKLVHSFDGEGILLAMHNTDKSIYSFARACFTYALDIGQDLWFATKDTISKTYDHRFKDIFAEVYDSEFCQKFEAKGISYDYSLIDDSVARAVKSKGGFVWALKNYDGDVLSDMAASAMGSLAMMTSVLVSPDGCFEYEAAHGTVTRHYYKYKAGEITSTNSVASIFAWSGALRKRGQLDGNAQLVAFAGRLEEATLAVIDGGIMTGDLLPLYNNSEICAKRADSLEFIRHIQNYLQK